MLLATVCDCYASFHNEDTAAPALPGALFKPRGRRIAKTSGCYVLELQSLYHVLTVPILVLQHGLSCVLEPLVLLSAYAIAIPHAFDFLHGRHQQQVLRCQVIHFGLSIHASSGADLTPPATIGGYQI